MNGVVYAKGGGDFEILHPLKIALSVRGWPLET